MTSKNNNPENQTKALAEQAKRSVSYSIRSEDKAEAEVMLKAFSPANQLGQSIDVQRRPVRPRTDVLIRRYGSALLRPNELKRLAKAHAQFLEHQATLEFHSVSSHNLRIREASSAYSAEPSKENAEKLFALRSMSNEDIASANQAATARKTLVVDSLIDLEIEVLNRLASALEADAGNVSQALEKTYKEFGCDCADALAIELARMSSLNRKRARILASGRGRGESELNPLFEAILKEHQTATD